MGVLEDILSWTDNKRRVAAKNVKDFASNPSDFLSMVTGRVAESNKKMAAGDTEEILNAVDPTGASGLGGMIRRGGRADLNMTHETVISKLRNMLVGRSSLTNPSIAIASNDVAPFRGLHDTAASIIMNPAASHYFDPALNKTAQLANRDTYTTLHKDLLPPDFRTANPESLRLTEGVRSRRIEDYQRAGSPVNDTQHMLSILGSPEFSSFAAYERSRYGAKTLDRKSALSEEATQKALEQHFPDLMELLQHSDTKLLDAGLTLDMFKRKAKAGDIESQKLFDILGSTVSDYAELKLAGELPLNSHTVSAVMLPPSTQLDKTAAGHLKYIKDKADKKGIRVGSAAELMPADFKTTYDDLASASLERIKKGLEIPNSYFSALERTLLRETPTGEAEVMAKQFMQESPRFAADTASILTARDLDAILKGNP